MAAPVPLRPDFDGAALRTLAKSSRDPDQIRRLLALSAIYEGSPRSEAAALGGVGLQTVRDWVLAFNAEGPHGLIGGKAPGARPRSNAGDEPESGRDRQGRHRRRARRAAARPGWLAHDPEAHRAGQRHAAAAASALARTEPGREPLAVHP